MPTKPRAYSYIRFSNATQAQGDSYRRQREDAETYCEQHGLELVDSKEYLFFDAGRSAYKARHLDDSGELARFLAYVEDGTVPAGSVLIVESLDRLSRENVQTKALPRFLDLLGKGIDVVTLTDNKRYSAGDDFTSLIISIVYMARAHEESATKGKRVSSAWKIKHEKAQEKATPIGKLCPYWLRFEGGEYHLIPERVKVVQRIYQLAQDGYGHRAISIILNKENIPSFSAERKNASGKWGNSSIAHLLKNRSVLGEYHPHRFVDGVRTPIGEGVKNYFPSIISEDVFYAAQQAINSRKSSQVTRTSGNFNVWAGVAKCEYCRGALHLTNAGRSKNLRCFNNTKGVCPAKPVALIRSEEVFKEILSKVDSLSLVQDNSAKLQQQVAVLDGKIGSITSRLNEIQEQVLAFGGRIPSMLVSTMAKLEDEQAAYMDEREKLKADLGRERIVSKEEFFSRLDMVSYEGRAKANSLLKTLGISVRVRRGEGRGEKAEISYMVDREGETVFSLNDHPLYGIMFFAFEAGSLDAAVLQGDISEQDSSNQAAFIERIGVGKAKQAHLKEMAKNMSYRQIAEKEGMSVREVKRVLGIT
ncbi:recombinase family protein [Metapseudomonas otitidis]|uniref:recombinase family protein n=1 Tax=Metapseudomonas otitidis TaxID=319939 RepID=UPI0013F5B482|nr:recombinase family protein [Pseudomonas otitidis]